MQPAVMNPFLRVKHAVLSTLGRFSCLLISEQGMCLQEDSKVKIPNVPLGACILAHLVILLLARQNCLAGRLVAGGLRFNSQCCP